MTEWNLNFAGSQVVNLSVFGGSTCGDETKTSLFWTGSMKEPKSTFFEWITLICAGQRPTFTRILKSFQKLAEIDWYCS